MESGLNLDESGLNLDGIWMESGLNLGGIWIESGWNLEADLRCRLVFGYDQVHRTQARAPFL